MYEMTNSKSINNINSKDAGNVKQVSTSTTKSNSLLYFKPMITAIHVSNTFVAHALTQYAEVNRKNSNDTTITKVTAITNTNANANKSMNVKNTPIQDFDQ